MLASIIGFASAQLKHQAALLSHSHKLSKLGQPAGGGSSGV